MENREIKKIILPATNKEVEIYTYITGGEKRQITEILTGNLSADLTGSAKGEIPLTLVYQANDKALSLLVKTLNEQEIKDLPSKDYDFLLSEVNKISNDTDFSQKKTV
jgi:hypothetical protein